MANKLKNSKVEEQESDFNEKMQKEKNPQIKVKEVVKDDRTSKLVGIFSMLIFVILFFSFSSYIFTWQDDQDKVQNFGIKIFSIDNLGIQNIFGALGAYISYFFIYNGFGLASFLICTFFFVLAINLLAGSKIFKLARNVKYVLVGLLVLSVACTFFSGMHTEFAFGGSVGNLLTAWLEKWLGHFGTGCLLIITVACYIIWRFNPSFKFTKTKKWLSKEMASLAKEKETEFKEEVPVTKPSTSRKVARVSEEENILSPESAVSTVPESENNGATLIINQTEEDSQESDPFDDIPTMPLTTATNPNTKPKSGVTIIPPTQPKLDIPTMEGDEEEGIPFEIPTMDSHSNGNVSLEINPTTDSVEPEDLQESELEKEPVDVSQLADYDPTLGLSNYKHPTIEMLEDHASGKQESDPQELENNKNQIVTTLKNYDIAIQKISATVGPTVTLYEIVPAPGVRISKIKNLEDDIALSLAALGIRIIAPIPGRGTIGIEVPNINKSVVSMRSLINSEKFKTTKYSLPIALGKKINNENFIVDLASMPHLLMAGATGQGKSVGINAILVSLLYKKHPSQLKFVLVDPKKVELSIYRVIEKHFLAKLPNEEEAIITDTKKVIATLNALCIEMDNRYDLLKEAGCRNIKEYNEKFIHRRLNPQKGHQYLPFIVLVIDEFADLIMTAGKEVEMPIARLAQLARAVGIHLIVATQRPSVNILTGTIKANFPARIAFKVSSKIDSRTILDAGGAEQLIGKGDMLISYNGDLTRLQCAFVDTPEVEKVVESIGDQQGYPDAFLLPEYEEERDSENASASDDLADRDTRFEEAARMVVQTQTGSTSMLQRRLKLGYNRAGRIMDQLEMAGVVGPNLGSKVREVLMKTEEELQVLLDNLP